MAFDPFKPKKPELDYGNLYDDTEVPQQKIIMKFQILKLVYLEYYQVC